MRQSRRPRLCHAAAVSQCRLHPAGRNHDTGNQALHPRRTAEPLAVVHRGQALAVESWGAGPTVLLVHGWNGRGAQLGAFAPALVKSGYRVVTFDTPAHGRSPGRATNLPEISEAIHAGPKGSDSIETLCPCIVP